MLINYESLEYAQKISKDMLKPIKNYKGKIEILKEMKPFNEDLFKIEIMKKKIYEEEEEEEIEEEESSEVENISSSIPQDELHKQFNLILNTNDKSKFNNFCILNSDKLDKILDFLCEHMIKLDITVDSKYLLLFYDRFQNIFDINKDFQLILKIISKYTYWAYLDGIKNLGTSNKILPFLKFIIKNLSNEEINNYFHLILEKLINIWKNKNDEKIIKDSINIIDIFLTFLIHDKINFISKEKLKEIKEAFESSYTKSGLNKKVLHKLNQLITE